MPAFSERLGCTVQVKREDLQAVHSFKMWAASGHLGGGLSRERGGGDAQFPVAHNWHNILQAEYVCCMYSVEAEDGVVTDWHVLHYATRAMGSSVYLILFKRRRRLRPRLPEG